MVVSALTLGDLRENPAVPYEQDEVTRIIQDDVNEAEYRKIRGWTVAQLNLARCAAREAELAAAAAFTGPDGQVTRLDLIRAMNRLSSAIYLLMIRQKRKEGSS